MAHLAGTDAARPVSLGSIAEAEGLPLAYLEHLVQRLRRQGLVESRRGAHGGYKLSRPAKEITMAGIVSALQGDPPPNQGITPERVWPREGKGGAPRPPQLSLAPG